MAEEKQWHIVSDDYLDKLGGWFLKWGQDFYQAHYNSLQMHVTPGATPEGVAFKEEFNKRKEELSTRLDKARDAFTNCGYELKRMSREHYNTEHDNKADAEKIRGFVTDGLAHDYQSASVLVPPPPGGYPPPAPGATPSNNGSASK